MRRLYDLLVPSKALQWGQLTETWNTWTFARTIQAFERIRLAMMSAYAPDPSEETP